MSPAELLVECPTCHRTHAANAGCDHRDESPGCVVAAPVGPRVTTFATPMGQADVLYRELAAAEAEVRRLRALVPVLERQRDEAVAVLRRLRDLAVPPSSLAATYGEWCSAVADAGRLLAQHPAPLVETYPCGCRGTPGYRCPVHSCP